MIRDSVVDIIAQRLGNRTDLTDAIIAEMQLAQEMRLEQSGTILPWFLATEYTEVETVAGEGRLVLPDDFICEVEDSGFWILNPDNAVWIELKKRNEDDILNKYGVIPDMPQMYSLVGEQFTLGPIPDAVYTLRMKYYAKDESLATNIENKWLKYAADLVIAEVGYVMASKHTMDDALAQSYLADKGVAWNRLNMMNETRQHANRDYSMGDH